MSQANQAKISKNSQKIVNRRTEAKLAALLTDIDYDRSKLISFEQLGRVLTVTGVSKVITYDDNFQRK